MSEFIEQLTEQLKPDWKDRLPKLETNQHYRLPNGATVFPVAYGKEDGIIYYAWDGNSIHIYSGETESEANIEIHLYDNLSIEIRGWRKDNPTITIKGDEFPCTLELDKESMRNITVVTKRRET